MSSRSIFSALLATASLALPSMAQAAELKLGIVDYQRAVLEVDQGKAARARLEQLKDAKQKEFDKAQDALAKEGDVLQKQAPTMTEAARQTQGAEYQKKVVELRQSMAKGEQDLAQGQRDAFGPIEERMQGVVSAVAQREGFSVVLIKQAVAYSPPSLDVTNAVIRMYNDKFKDTASTPAPKKTAAPPSK
jgi:outer membrane protein